MDGEGTDERDHGDGGTGGYGSWRSHLGISRSSRRCRTDFPRGSCSPHSDYDHGPDPSRHLYEDLNQSNKLRMEIVVSAWKEHLLQRDRMTKDEQEVIENLRALRSDPNPPEEWVSLSVEKEVLNRRVRAEGLPPDYIDQ